MRRMSFSATVEQMRDQTKTVTRRAPDTWANLKPGDQLLAVEKAMGLPKGEKQVPIGVIEVVVNGVERLDRIGWTGEAEREGFSSPEQFQQVWERMHGKWDPTALVRRISFRHER